MEASSWWGITFLLGVIAVVIIVCNLMGYLQAIRTGRGYSFVSFVGGVAGAGVCLCCPMSDVWHWAWVPLLLDITIPLCVYGWLTEGRRNP